MKHFVVTHRLPQRRDDGPVVLVFVFVFVTVGGMPYRPQCLTAGLVDEIQLHVGSVILGQGVPSSPASSSVELGLHRRHLKAGQEVAVRLSTGALVAFRVDEVTRQSKDALPESRMWDPGGRPQLAIITCGGKFDRKLRSYPDNVIVYATMSERIQPPTIPT
ncbi:MAG: class F sortase [Acidimicrobiales bacterium]